MSEREVTTTGEVSLGGGPWPFKAGLSRSTTRRWTERGFEALAPAVAAVGEESLSERLEANEELDVLVARAVPAAAESASAAKRQLLARVVKAAVLDDAKIDDSSLVVDVLQRIDVPHIRCLEDVYRAEQGAIASGDLTPTARGAERELTEQVRAVAATYPPPLVQQLQSLGLLDGSLTWDGVIHVTGTTVFGAQILADLRSVTEQT